LSRSARFNAGYPVSQGEIHGVQESFIDTIFGAAWLNTGKQLKLHGPANLGV
jgi:hypothetical protein